MTSISLIGLSGAKAAEVRIANSANNLANSRSTSTLDVTTGVQTDDPFVLQVVQQSSLEPSGVSSSLSPLKPPTLPLYDPTNPAANDDGIVEFPNVDVANEAIIQIQAKSAYSASLKTIQAGSAMVQSLFDIKS